MNTRIDGVRAALVTLLSPLVASGGGVSPYFPDAANVLPSLWLADARGTIKRAMSDVTFDYSLPLTGAYARKAVYAEERATGTALMIAALDLILADHSLGGLITLMQPTGFTEGIVGPVGGEEFVGFTIALSIKEKNVIG